MADRAGRIAHAYGDLASGRLDDDFNLYTYVGNDPLDRTDPTGLDCKSDSGTTTCDVQITGSRIPQKISFPTPAEVTGTQKSSSASEHSYAYTTPHNKSDSAVQKSMINDPTPAANDKPATEKGTPNSATPDGGRGTLAKISAGLFGDNPKSPVMSYTFENGSDTWEINVTQPGHGLHFGYVLRGSVDGKAMSLGEGWAWKQKAPGLAGWVDNVWIQQNQKNIDEAQ